MLCLRDDDELLEYVSRGREARQRQRLAKVDQATERERRVALAHRQVNPTPNPTPDPNPTPHPHQVRLEVDPITEQACGRAELTFRNVQRYMIYDICVHAHARMHMHMHKHVCACKASSSPARVPHVTWLSPLPRRALLGVLQAQPDAIMGARLLQFTPNPHPHPHHSP